MSALPITLPDSIRYLSLDLDDTLWPILPTIKRAEEALMAWFQQHAPRVAENYGIEGLRALSEQVHQRHPHLHHDLGAQRRLCLRLALSSCGYHPGMMHGAWELFHHLRLQVDLFADAQALLQTQREVKLIAVSNGNADLKRIGLKVHFHHAFHAHEVALRKPDPALWQHVVHTLNCTPEQILHVGDHPLEDAESARQAGLHVLWLNREQRPWPLESAPVPSIDSLQPLVHWLARSGAQL